MNTFVRVLALLAALPIVTAAAADLPDPTRPPMAQPQPHRTVAASGNAAPAAAPAAPVLQSVLIGEGRKPSAIISGRLVELGGAVDGMHLTRLTQAGAVLTGARGTTTLALTPGAEKQFAAVPADTPAARLATAPAGAHKLVAPAGARKTASSTLPFRVAE